MTQGRKIAFAYVLAVPAVLAVVFFERVSLLRVSDSETGMAQSSEVLRNCDLAISVLKEADLRPVPASGNATVESSPPPSVQLSDAIQSLHELTRNEAAAQPQLRTVDRLLAERTALRQSVGRSGSSSPGDEARGRTLANSIAIVIGEIATAHQIELQQQAEVAGQDVRWANAAVLYGGFLTVWLIGVAAVLLFHDERTRAWKGVERRVHTRILEELPIGVCLTTGAGTILYSNHAEAAILGYEPAELFAKDVNIFVASAETEPAFDDLIDRLPANRSWYGELALTKRDRSLLTVASWVTNLEVAGKFFRVYIHDPFSRQAEPPVLETATRVNGD